MINHAYSDEDMRDSDCVTKAADGVQKVATLLAGTMHTLSAGKQPKKTASKHIQASNKTVDDLLYTVRWCRHGVTYSTQHPTHITVTVYCSVLCTLKSSMFEGNFSSLHSSVVCTL